MPTNTPYLFPIVCAPTELPAVAPSVVVLDPLPPPLVTSIDWLPVVVGLVNVPEAGYEPPVLDVYPRPDAPISDPGGALVVGPATAIATRPGPGSAVVQPAWLGAATAQAHYSEA